MSTHEQGTPIPIPIRKSDERIWNAAASGFPRDAALILWQDN
jgi:hypothetical protein